MFHSDESKWVGRVGQNVPVQSFIVNYGYWALFILAFLESACVPIPSEVTFGFAGALCAPQFAAQFANHHPFNVIPVIVVGVAGSVAGSIVAYELGRTAGRSIVDRWGRWLLLTHKDLDRSEAWFNHWGKPSVLIGRVVPVVRTFISFPAGAAKMARVPFVVLTAIGCTVWVSTLTLLGRAAGANWNHVASVVKVLEIPIIIAIVVGLVWGFVARWRHVRADHARHGAS